jgi:hypothetical protein
MLGAGLLLGALCVKNCSVPALPVIPPLSSSVIGVRPTPNVLVAVKDLARLESASFHMERVIDLTDKQSRLFGLIETGKRIWRRARGRKRSAHWWIGRCKRGF